MGTKCNCSSLIYNVERGLVIWREDRAITYHFSRAAKNEETHGIFFCVCALTFNPRNKKQTEILLLLFLLSFLPELVTLFPVCVEQKDK